MNESEAVRPRQLKGENAPGVLEHSNGAIGSGCFDALFQVDFVEAQCRDPRLWRLKANVGLKLPDSRQIGKCGRVVCQMSEGDEGMGFTAAVVDGEFSICFVGLTSQAETHIFDQFPQVVGGEGEGEEFVGVFVNGSLALLHDHVIQVSGKYGQREFAGLQVVAQLHDLVPGFMGEFSRHVKPRSGVILRLR